MGQAAGRSAEAFHKAVGLNGRHPHEARRVGEGRRRALGRRRERRADRLPRNGRAPRRARTVRADPVRLPAARDGGHPDPPRAVRGALEQGGGREGRQAPHVRAGSRCATCARSSIRSARWARSRSSCRCSRCSARPSSTTSSSRTRSGDSDGSASILDSLTPGELSDARDHQGRPDPPDRARERPAAPGGPGPAEAVRARRASPPTAWSRTAAYGASSKAPVRGSGRRPGVSARTR